MRKMSKNRLKELTYFCRQYNDWKEETYRLMDLYASEISCPIELFTESKEKYIQKMDMVTNSIIQRKNYIQKMDMVMSTIEQSVKEFLGFDAQSEIPYAEERFFESIKSALFANICYGSTYEQLYFTYPGVSKCPRHKFYKLRKLFFCNLNKVKD